MGCGPCRSDKQRVAIFSFPRRVSSDTEFCVCGHQSVQQMLETIGQARTTLSAQKYPWELMGHMARPLLAPEAGRRESAISMGRHNAGRYAFLFHLKSPTLLAQFWDTDTGVMCVSLQGPAPMVTPGHGWGVKPPPASGLGSGVLPANYSGYGNPYSG